MSRSASKPIIHESILDNLREYIQQNDLHHGDLIPPERELAALWNVSRCSIREVLHSLELAGAINRRSRRGTIISNNDPTIFLNSAQSLVPPKNDSLLQLMEARRIIEVAVLPLVIERATEDDFARMEEANRLMLEAVKKGVDCTQHDIDLHKAILAAADNRYLIQFGDVVQELGRVSSGSDYDNDMEIVHRHNQLIIALRNRNLDDARKLLDTQLVMPAVSAEEWEAVIHPDT